MSLWSHREKTAWVSAGKKTKQKQEREFCPLFCSLSLSSDQSGSSPQIGNTRKKYNNAVHRSRGANLHRLCCHFNQSTWRRVSCWTQPGWRFWSLPSCKGQQQILQTQTDTNIHWRNHYCCSLWDQKKITNGRLHMAEILPWTTKLTACLSACVRTAQSAELMCDRVRLRPMMESTYPKQHKTRRLWPVIVTIQSTLMLCPFTPIDFELLGLTSVLDWTCCRTTMNKLVFMVS